MKEMQEFCQKTSQWKISTHTNFAHYWYLMMLFIIISSVQPALLFLVLFSTKRKIAVAHSNNNLTNSTS